MVTNILAAATAAWQQTLMAELQGLAMVALKPDERGKGLPVQVGDAWRAVRDLDPDAAVRIVVGRLGNAFELAEGELADQLRRCLDLALLGRRPGLVAAMAAANGPETGAGRYWAVVGPDGISLHDERGDDEAFATVPTEAEAVAALKAHQATRLAQESAPAAEVAA
ncbi:MAG: hypothetical protein GC191_09385 [Azospirillum sp.]|nr:hypothetical protein [Azospirillum sp.]